MTTFPYVLLDVPSPLVDEAVERNDELLREVQLVGRGTDPVAVAGRLEQWHRRIATAGDGRELMLEAFRSSGRTGAVELPLGAEHDLVALGLLLDEADDASERGELLTLPRRAPLAALHWWAVTEAVRQRHGLPPTPYSGPTGP